MELELKCCITLTTGNILDPLSAECSFKSCCHLWIEDDILEDKSYLYINQEYKKIKKIIKSYFHNDTEYNSPMVPRIKSDL